MSNALPPKPRLVGSKTRICIVASKYNEKFTDALVENAIEELDELNPQLRIDLIRVPGAFEIPVVVANLLRKNPPACIIALGLIIRGAFLSSHRESGRVLRAPGVCLATRSIRVARGSASAAFQPVSVAPNTAVFGPAVVLFIAS